MSVMPPSTGPSETALEHGDMSRGNGAASHGAQGGIVTGADRAAMSSDVIRLASEGAVLDPTVPQPTSYQGRSYIALELPGGNADWFSHALFDPMEEVPGSDDQELHAGRAALGRPLSQNGGGGGHDPNPPSQPTNPITLDLAIDAPASGTEVTLASGGTLTVTGTASVRTGGGSISKVEVRQSGSTAWHPAALTGKNWTRNGLVVPAGNVTIYARATHSGKTIVKEVAIDIVVQTQKTTPTQTDKAPPVLTVTTPPLARLNAPFVLADDKLDLAIGGTVTDDTAVAEITVELDGAGQEVRRDGTKWSCVLPLRGIGDHAVTIRARDTAATPNSAVRALTIHAVATPPQKPWLERLMLVETYRLSSYLTRYGVGRPLKTFSLLPGESTELSVSTFMRNEETRAGASNILDSFSEDTSDEFASALNDEQTSSTSEKETSNYKISASAKASWGWGSASISGELGGGSAAARDELVKNVKTATEKHVATASAKREVQINTTYEVKRAEGEETSIKRTIENLNKSRTLNFVFSQMVQEFVTILHLVDVRVAYYREDLVADAAGKETRLHTYREATLPQLRALLDQVIVAGRQGETLAAIRYQLEHIVDHQDRVVSFVEQASFKDDQGNPTMPDDSYLRVRKDLTTEYRPTPQADPIGIPGVIMAKFENVLSTDAVVVEALLGSNNGLDDYSSALQEASAEQKRAESAKARAEAAKLELALDIVRTNDKARAALFASCFPPPPGAAGLPVVMVDGASS